MKVSLNSTVHLQEVHALWRRDHAGLAWPKHLPFRGLVFPEARPKEHGAEVQAGGAVMKVQAPILIMMCIFMKRVRIFLRTQASLPEFI